MKITFQYYTGVKKNLFRNPRLLGSWDAQGNYSNQWMTTPMAEITGWDGCPAFSAEVDLNSNQAGWTFYWGVLFDTEIERDVWGIMTEVKDSSSTDRYRTFRLPDNSEATWVERYYLNESRRLGAQKYYVRPDSPPVARFAVWAPNAVSVEVVFGYLFDAGDPSRKPIEKSIDKRALSGGYISDQGEGARADWAIAPMTREEDGIWVSDIDDPFFRDFNALDHTLYMYRIRQKGEEGYRYRTDLYSRCQVGTGDYKPAGPFTGRISELDGTVGCSVVIDPDRVTEEFDEPVFPETKWLSQEAFWEEEKDFPERPALVEDLVIYELHLGALGFGKDKDTPGDLQDAIDFLPYLKELGINTIELLPLSQFGGGTANWGYSTSHYFAIEYSGGGRDQFKHFIKECHRLGFSVIMDVVYNHYSHDAERSEWMYDTNEHAKNVYYWYEGDPSDYGAFDRAVTEAGQSDRVGTGGYVDNMSTGWAPRYHEEQVRKMFISSAIALVLEFNVDGFRLDQTTSIHAYNKLHADGRTLNNVNKYGAKLLREFTSTLKLVKPEIMLMAEDHSNEAFVTNARHEGGLGFDAAWYADYYHHLVGDTDKGSDYAKLLRTSGLGGDYGLAMDYFAGALAASKYRKVVYSESHDEAGNSDQSDRNIWVGGTDRYYSEARGRVVAGITLFSAGTPMFLFGEEVCAEKKFLYGNVLENRENYLELKETSGRRMYRFYKDAIELRRKHVALRSGNLEVLYTHNDNRVLAFKKWDQREMFLIVATFSNFHFDNPGYNIPVDLSSEGGYWREIFNSNAEIYGGDDVGNNGGEIGYDNGFRCVIPRNSICVYKKTTA